ncbi:MAG: hypothetical protein A2566_01640 [Candidatus Zambryskibacteria bacterium RIFOXYD1_FULL_40_13]|nr:MAG: hypothetical protein UT25_C0001G0029 [Parcubacteria group bacterium GW2011_GWC1_39_12]KKR19553.1 MAG: hypothetical protein UT49_C0001G0029 [Parcubacteria group bacterium GW2011_GWF1_39_37]KKR35706.1 MAG: hypothetical protein UT68_C0001G0029 [Parcubacteria group bacterium GW2011_GWC2_40_10]KKR52521.1 MAG: hypothetical protein UT89_C0001G0029 [Parcubacteria group bacterium GW2011_GWE1_40_20]KKR64812.1 MAG: hypothetical protein UU06_C0039G0006 [Parcubacteria group bacterium GW2011_GWB1_40_
MHTRAQSAVLERKVSADTTRVTGLLDIIDKALLARDQRYTGPTFVSMNGPEKCRRGARVNFAQMVELESIYHGWVVEAYYNANDHGLKFTLRHR